MTEPLQRSVITSMVSAVGFPYVILLPLAGVVCFLLALIVVLRGKGPMATPALILIVHVPLLIGIFAATQGALASYTLMAASVATPKPADVAQGISTALVAPIVGLMLMVPGYATAAIGAFIRCLSADSEDSKTKS
jgi:hypothetical protein